MIKRHYRQVKDTLEELQSHYNPIEDDHQSDMFQNYQAVIDDINLKLNEFSI